MSEENDYTSGISATLKASEGFDAPWIVVHARNTEELIGHLTDLHESPVMTMVAQLSQQFQGNFEQKPRYQNKGGGSGSGWKRNQSAQTAGVPSNPGTSATPSNSAPPPPFVQNQQAQPAQWGQQQPVQQLQQQLGATVVAQAPNEVAYCPDHNAPREYKESFFNPRTQRQVSASWRCPVQGCKPWWQQDDGTWQRGK